MKNDGKGKEPNGGRDRDKFLKRFHELFHPIGVLHETLANTREGKAFVYPFINGVPPYKSTEITFLGGATTKDCFKIINAKKDEYSEGKYLTVMVGPSGGFCGYDLYQVCIHGGKKEIWLGANNVVCKMTELEHDYYTISSYNDLLIIGSCLPVIVGGLVYLLFKTATDDYSRRYAFLLGKTVVVSDIDLPVPKDGQESVTKNSFLKDEYVSESIKSLKKKIASHTKDLPKGVAEQGLSLLEYTPPLWDDPREGMKSQTAMRIDSGDVFLTKGNGNAYSLWFIQPQI